MEKTSDGDDTDPKDQYQTTAEALSHSRGALDAGLVADVAVADSIVAESGGLAARWED